MAFLVSAGNDEESPTFNRFDLFRFCFHNLGKSLPLGNGRFLIAQIYKNHNILYGLNQSPIFEKPNNPKCTPPFSNLNETKIDPPIFQNQYKWIRPPHF